MNDFSPNSHRAFILERHSGVVARALALIVLVALAIVIRVQTRPPAPQAMRRAVVESPQTNAERGRAVYGRYGCAMCHGTDGKGGFPNPNAETDGKVPGVTFVAEGYTAHELRKVILKGVATIGRADANGPRPPYRMPGWAGQIDEQEMEALVQYLMSLAPKSGEKWR